MPAPGILRVCGRTVYNATQSTCLDCNSAQTHERLRTGHRWRGLDALNTMEISKISVHTTWQIWPQPHQLTSSKAVNLVQHQVTAIHISITATAFTVNINLSNSYQFSPFLQCRYAQTAVLLLKQCIFVRAIQLTDDNSLYVIEATSRTIHDIRCTQIHWV